MFINMYRTGTYMFVQLTVPLLFEFNMFGLTPNFGGLMNKIVFFKLYQYIPGSA